MANRINANKLTSTANYISEKLPSTKLRSKDNPRSDDVIAYLANAYENARARQVTEWEQMRRYKTPSLHLLSRDLF